MRFTPKKILGIHGKGSDINKFSWQERKKVLKENGIDLELFQFARLDDPSFKDWETTFREIDFLKYDGIFTSSLGGIMTLKYMYENNISTKRLVMTVPGISFKTLDGEKPNIEKIYKDFGKPNLSNLAEEIIVVSAKDDDITPYQSSQEIAKMTKADFILHEKGGHKLEGHLNSIVDLIKNGSE